MNSKEPAPWRELQEQFEGREAIYVEKGVLRVRVSNIRANLGSRTVSMTIEEIPTPGLQIATFRGWIGNGTAPLVFHVAAGYRSRFSLHTWKMGYGGWSLYFVPTIIASVMDIASRFPEGQKPPDRYNQLLSHLMKEGVFDERTHPVFPEQ